MRWRSLAGASLALPHMASSVSLPSSFSASSTNADDNTGKPDERDPLVVDELEITNVALTCNRRVDTQPYNCDMRFDMYDPNSEAWERVSRVSCRHTWNWDGRTPEPSLDTPYSICWMSNTSHAFQTRINSFTSPANFTMNVAINYVRNRETSNPEDIHIFFEPNISLTKVTLLHNSMYYVSTGVLRFHYSGITI